MEVIALAVALVLLCALFSWHVHRSEARLSAVFRDALETVRASSLKEKVEAEHLREEFSFQRKQMQDAFEKEVREAKKRQSAPPDFAMTEDGRQIEVSRLEPVSPSELSEFS